MSYARFGDDSDVYVIPTESAFDKVNPRHECMACRLLEGKTFVSYSEEEAIEHLRQHVIAGHKVPEYAFERLLWEWVGRPPVERPIVLYRGGFDMPDEPEAISSFFPMVTSRARIPRGSLVIGRYSVLPYYKELCDDLEANDSRLINSYRQHRYIADLGNWYRDLAPWTFETWPHLDAVPDDAWPCVLKGETNSAKWQWRHRMFAKDRQAALEVRSLLEKDGLLADQHVYFRRFVPLMPVDVENIGSGPPISRELRFFVCDDAVLCGASYWHDDPPEANWPKPNDVPPELLRDVIQAVGKNARFYVIDVAQTAEGKWVLVELNDGQMSGLSQNRPRVLYSELARRLGCPANEPRSFHVSFSNTWGEPWGTTSK